MKRGLLMACVVLGAAIGIGVLGGATATSEVTVEAERAGAIDAAAPLAGMWRAELGGRVYEEMWMPPAHGQMTGALRSFDDEGNVRLLELLTIREVEGGLEYSVRHFDAEMTPWASEAPGPLVMRSTGDDPLAFTPHKGGETLEGLRIDAGDAGRVRVTIAFKGESGRAPLVLDFGRVDSEP